MVRKNKKYRRLIKKHQKLVVAIAIIVLALVAFALTRDNEPSYSTAEPNTPGESTEEPTDTEEPSTQQQPNNPKTGTSSNNPIPSNPGVKKTVTPIITSASHDGQYMVVRSYVSGVFENGGTCKAVFTKDSFSVTGSSKGFQNVSYTTCAPIKISSNKFFTAGDWVLKVSYSSAKAEGTSESQVIRVK